MKDIEKIIYKMGTELNLGKMILFIKENMPMDVNVV